MPLGGVRGDGSGDDSPAKCSRELSVVTKNILPVFISIGMCAMRVYAFVKTHSTVHLRFIYFTVHKVILIQEREKRVGP